MTENLTDILIEKFHNVTSISCLLFFFLRCQTDLVFHAGKMYDDSDSCEILPETRVFNGYHSAGFDQDDFSPDKGIVKIPKENGITKVCLH